MRIIRLRRQHTRAAMRGADPRRAARLLRYLVEDAAGAMMDLGYQIRDRMRARKRNAGLGRH